MKRQILIAHARGEQGLAESLAEPIRAAGYDAVHEGTLLVGDSIHAEASKALAEGAALVICGTARAMGTKMVRLLANAARRHGTVVFTVRMEQDADTDVFTTDEVIAEYWVDPTRAVDDLVRAVQERFPISADPAAEPIVPLADRRSVALDRYCELALETCDLVDLANLPEDRHITSRQLELRRLYLPLRVNVDAPMSESEVEEDATRLEAIEKKREIDRLYAAGRALSRKARAPRRAAVGERLKSARRIVVLGDPGAGKSTLLRWIATVFLLRRRNDPSWKAIPDASTLPDEEVLPIVVRCRDLDAAACGCLDDILKHTLRKSEMAADEVDVLPNLLREELVAGRAVLLIDGLDEMSDPKVRVSLCQQIEKICTAYPNAPIVVTSRIVGYRELGYRIGRGFEHVTIAELDTAGKDDFARRWCDATELPERRERATDELIRSIHVNDRIERLTSNPLLLTTMALVRRKVGKLPTRRAELYWEAVQVLLNWRSEVDQPMDPQEALPQLEYIAFAMCQRGVQRLRVDEVLELLAQVRVAYPQLRRVQDRSPEEFLHLVERRTSLLIEAGRELVDGLNVRVFEFRHLTFQEYLAGRALALGRFPGRDTTRSRKEYIADFAGQTETERARQDPSFREALVRESWREPLRLCIASWPAESCVDEALLAISRPREDEEHATIRARAILAAQCLADEPNVHVETANEVLRGFSAILGDNDGDGIERTGADMAGVELARSEWNEPLVAVLLEEFRRCGIERREGVGGTASSVLSFASNLDSNDQRWLEEQAECLRSNDVTTRIRSALVQMEYAFNRAMGRGAVESVCIYPIEELLKLLLGEPAEAHAAAWALGWMSLHCWNPADEEMTKLVESARSQLFDDRAMRWVLAILGRRAADLGFDRIAQGATSPIAWLRMQVAVTLEEIVEPRSIGVLIGLLDDSVDHVREAAARALATGRDVRIVDAVSRLVEDSSGFVRAAAMETMARMDDPRATEMLLGLLEGRNRDLTIGAVEALAYAKDARAQGAILARLDDADSRIRSAAVNALSVRGGPEALEALVARLHEPQRTQMIANALFGLGTEAGIAAVASLVDHDFAGVRRLAVQAIATKCEPVEKKILSKDIDGMPPWMDPRKPITDARVQEVAAGLNLTPEIVRALYEDLPVRLGLRLNWRKKADEVGISTDAPEG